MARLRANARLMGSLPSGTPASDNTDARDRQHGESPWRRNILDAARRRDDVGEHVGLRSIAAEFVEAEWRAEAHGENLSDVLQEELLREVDILNLIIEGSTATTQPEGWRHGRAPEDSSLTVLDTVHSVIYYVFYSGGHDMVERDTTDLSELRRGVLVLAVLSQLRTPQYGYSLRQALVDGGMPIEEGTLYPLLRRLEAQGLLASEWNTEHAPPRRYYRLSTTGKRTLAAMTHAWRDQVRVINTLLD